MNPAEVMLKMECVRCGRTLENTETQNHDPKTLCNACVKRILEKLSFDDVVDIRCRIESAVEKRKRRERVKAKAKGVGA